MKFVQEETRLSAHFKVSEATDSYIADRFGIDNRLPIDLLDNAIFIAEELLEPARQYFEVGFSPTSFYRCPLLCKKMKKKGTISKRISQHTLALAVDLKIPNVSLLETAKYFYVWEDFDQLILEFYDPLMPNRGWVHVSRNPDKNKNRNEFLIFDGKSYEDAEKLGIFNKRYGIDINGKMKD
jgi:hypothetical protein